jgi:16S rRNA (uracil1498-N3)-methyltransferase
MKTRLFVSARLFNDADIVLEGDRARYLGRVLRLSVGDAITLFDGTGPEWSASIEGMSKNSATLHVGESHEANTESPLRIHLVQGISRGERMDYVVQKATELGVKRITPVLTAYGVVKLDDKRAAKRCEHWRGVAASACEQSGRTRLPLIDAPLPLKTWFGAKPADADIDLVLRPGASRALAAIHAPQTKVCILVGPEGGFSQTEYEDAEVAGFDAVSLGPRVLRTETAAAAALAVMQAAWGDLA